MDKLSISMWITTYYIFWKHYISYTYALEKLSLTLHQLSLTLEKLYLDFETRMNTGLRGCPKQDKQDKYIKQSI